METLMDLMVCSFRIHPEVGRWLVFKDDDASIKFTKLANTTLLEAINLALKASVMGAWLRECSPSEPNKQEQGADGGN